MFMPIVYAYCLCLLLCLLFMPIVYALFMLLFMPIHVSRIAERLVYAIPKYFLINKLINIFHILGLPNRINSEHLS